MTTDDKAAGGAARAMTSSYAITSPAADSTVGATFTVVFVGPSDTIDDYGLVIVTGWPNNPVPQAVVIPLGTTPVDLGGGSYQFTIPNVAAPSGDFLLQLYSDPAGSSVLQDSIQLTR